MVLDREQGWRPWRPQDLCLRLLGAVHGYDGRCRRLVRSKFTIWPSGACPVLPPPNCAQAQELVRKARSHRAARRCAAPPIYLTIALSTPKEDRRLTGCHVVLCNPRIMSLRTPSCTV